MVVEKGFKKTEIGVIPENWNSIGIQDLINNNFIVGHLDGNHGALYPRSNEFIETGVPYIGANDFYNGRVLFSNCKYLSLQRASVFRKGIAIDGDVLFAHNATVGPVALLRTNFDFVILSTTATYFRCNSDKILNLYLLYFLQSQNFIKQFSAVMAQSTRNQIPITAQRKLNVILPSLPEQTAIANVLSDMDALIAQTEKLIEKKKAIKQGVMQELLKPKEGWVTKKLGENALILRGGSPRPIEDYLTTAYDGINWIKIGDVGKNAKYITSTEEKITPDGMSRSRVVKPGDFLLSNSMSFGRPYIMQIDGCIHDGWLVITEYESNFDRDFLYYVLGSEAVFTQYKSMASGSSVLNLNKEIVKEVNVICPISLDEQRYIAGVLSDIDVDLDFTETKLQKLKHQKQGMMQALLTGKIRLI